MSAGGAATVTLALLLCVYIGGTLLNNTVIDRAYNYTDTRLQIKVGSNMSSKLIIIIRRYCAAAVAAR